MEQGPLDLATVVGLDLKTAIGYANSTQALLATAAEEQGQGWRSGR